MTQGERNGWPGRRMSVLLLDAEGYYALPVVRCLAKAGIAKVSVLSANRSAAVRLSRHCDTFHYYPSGGLLSTVRDLVARTSFDVLLPIDEEAVEFVSSNFSAFAEVAAVPPVADPEAIRVCTDKWRFAEFCAETGISTPATVRMSGDLAADLASLDPDAAVLLKPMQGSGGLGIQRLAAPGEVVQFLSQHGEYAKTHVAQSFFPGVDIDCSVLCRDGEVLAYTIQVGILPGEDEFSPPSAVEFAHNDRVFGVAEALVAALRWQGIAHLDMRYDEATGRAAVLELNPRYWVSLIASLVAGVNFPALNCFAALGHNFDVPAYATCQYFSTKGLLRWTTERLAKHQLAFPFSHSSLPYMLADPLPETSRVLTWICRRMPGQR